MVVCGDREASIRVVPSAAADTWFDAACAALGLFPERTALFTKDGRNVTPADSLASLRLGEGDVFFLEEVPPSGWVGGLKLGARTASD